MGSLGFSSRVLCTTTTMERLFRAVRTEDYYSVSTKRCRRRRPSLFTRSYIYGKINGRRRIIMHVPPTSESVVLFGEFCRLLRHEAFFFFLFAGLFPGWFPPVKFRARSPNAHNNRHSSGTVYT